MRIEELLKENRIPELQPVSMSGDLVVVAYQGRKVTVTTEEGVGKRMGRRTPDFSLGEWNLGRDGGGLLPCWITGANSAVCNTSAKAYLKR